MGSGAGVWVEKRRRQPGKQRPADAKSFTKAKPSFRRAKPLVTPGAGPFPQAKPLLTRAPRSFPKPKPQVTRGMGSFPPRKPLVTRGTGSFPGRKPLLTGGAGSFTRGAGSFCVRSAVVSKDAVPARVAALTERSHGLGGR